MKYTNEYKDMLMAALQESSVVISFTKKDGSNRQMVCTTNPDLIPSDAYPTERKQTVIEDVEDPDFVRVFDLDVQGWRTIIFESILEIEPEALVMA